MKFALVNPVWTFEGSTYFGCQDPHFPIELLCAREMLRGDGHEVLLIDANIERLSTDETRARMAGFDADFLVIPTAPSYLFWRCPQPELRVPREWFQALGDGRAKKVAVGPHGSVTPRATLNKTGADVVLRGEPDQTLGQLATRPWMEITGCCWNDRGMMQMGQGVAATDMRMVPMLDYSDYPVELHMHKHHVFGETRGIGAEVEFARGCPSTLR